jgi:hypothetical protein
MFPDVWRTTSTPLSDLVAVATTWLKLKFDPYLGDLFCKVFFVHVGHLCISRYALGTYSVILDGRQCSIEGIHIAWHAMYVGDF